MFQKAAGRVYSFTQPNPTFKPFRPGVIGGDCSALPPGLCVFEAEAPMVDRQWAPPPAIKPSLAKGEAKGKELFCDCKSQKKPEYKL